MTRHCLLDVLHRKLLHLPYPHMQKHLRTQKHPRTQTRLHTRKHRRMQTHHVLSLDEGSLGIVLWLQNRGGGQNQRSMPHRIEKHRWVVRC